MWMSIGSNRWPHRSNKDLARDNTSIRGAFRCRDAPLMLVLFFSTNIDLYDEGKVVGDILGMINLVCLCCGVDTAFGSIT